MARDRKRAKQRQRQRRRTSDRQPAPVSARREVEETPEPLEHASAEVEIAEAAMAGAVPEAADLPPDARPDGADEGDAAEDEAASGDYLRDESDAGAAAPPARRDALAPGAQLPAEGTRVGNFLRACAAELRRVQWPDRRQVAQATGVVLGFVIIAGAYLGVLDAIFSRLIKVIL
jgi:preprotein translocase SecE subunit